MRGFLALEPRVSLVRHEPLQFPHPEPVATNAGIRDQRMLVAAASPKNLNPLQVDSEVSTIKQALAGFQVEGVKIAIDTVMDATPPEVEQALRGANSTYLFHFVGHGVSESSSDPFTRGATKEEGYLFFLEDKATKSQAKVKADDLARYLHPAGVRLAVMGACFSGNRSERYPWDSIAGAFAARGIPSTVAMQYEIFDTLAIRFAQAFYSSLSSGLSLDEAMSFGRLAMYREIATELDSVAKADWGVPVLYSRLSNGILFPEFAERDTTTAKQIRMAIQQTVDTIETTGEVTGIEAKLENGSYNVVQKVGVVKGKLTGAEGRA
ncbi:MAG: CHAT domain-containing protein [Acidobacteria bacterium]|nr:MAG: CHAT domain-containing protein [Acidobacteriota bacterium]